MLFRGYFVIECYASRSVQGAIGECVNGSSRAGSGLVNADTSLAAVVGMLRVRVHRCERRYIIIQLAVSVCRCLTYHASLRRMLAVRADEQRYIIL